MPITRRRRVTTKPQPVVVVSKKRASKPVAKLSKPVVRAVTKLVKGKEETKYWAQQLLQNAFLDGAIHTPQTSPGAIADIVPLVPDVPEGTNESSRIGRTITPTKCRVDLCLTFPQQVVGLPPLDMSQQANEIYVAIYLLRSKRFKSWDDYTVAVPKDSYATLLDTGQNGSIPFGTISSTTSPFWYTDTSYLQYPVNVSDYVQVKKKIVKLVRNQGLMFDGTPGVSPNLPQSSWSGSFTYKLPKLYYDDSGEKYPTNNCTMMAIGYAMANNNASYAANPDGSVGSPLPNALSVTARCHVWYKDA